MRAWIYLTKRKVNMVDSKLWAQRVISEVSESMDFLHEKKGKHGQCQALSTGHVNLWRIAVLSWLYAAKTTFCLVNIWRVRHTSQLTSSRMWISVVENTCRKFRRSALFLSMVVLQDGIYLGCPAAMPQLAVTIIRFIFGWREPAYPG